MPTIKSDTFEKLTLSIWDKWEKTNYVLIPYTEKEGFYKINDKQEKLIWPYTCFKWETFLDDDNDWDVIDPKNNPEDTALIEKNNYKYFY